MTVKDALKLLLDLPQDAQCGIIYDGADRADCEGIWLAQSGRVLFSSRELDTVYDDNDKPLT